MPTTPQPDAAKMTPTPANLPWHIGSRAGYNACEIKAWDATGHGENDQYFDSAICQVYGIPNNTTLEDLRNLPRYADSLARAEFIVESCNSHARLLAENAALVQALTEARGLLDEAAEPDYNQMAAEWDRAAQAHIRVIDAALALHQSGKEGKQS